MRIEECVLDSHPECIQCNCSAELCRTQSDVILLKGYKIAHTSNNKLIKLNKTIQRRD